MFCFSLLNLYLQKTMHLDNQKKHFGTGVLGFSGPVIKLVSLSVRICLHIHSCSGSIFVSVKGERDIHPSPQSKTISAAFCIGLQFSSLIVFDCGEG